jgi:hypothetical protein
MLEKNVATMQDMGMGRMYCKRPSPPFEVRQPFTLQFRAERLGKPRCIAMSSLLDVLLNPQTSMALPNTAVCRVLGITTKSSDCQQMQVAQGSVK